MAPGVVKTPFWPTERLDLVDEGNDPWVTTVQIADAMMDCITKPGVVGGTILEVLADKQRKVESLNDPGPAGPDSMLGKIATGFNDV